MKKQTIVLITVLMFILAGCGLTPSEEPQEEAKTLNVNDWPTPIVATPMPSPTPFPKVSVSTLPETDTSTNVTVVQTETETSKKAVIPPRVMQVILKQLDQEQIKTIMQRAANGANAREILELIDPADIQAIVEQLDPADIQAMIEQLEPADQQAVIELLGVESIVNVVEPAEQTTAVVVEQTKTTTETVTPADSESSDDNVDIMLAMLSQAESKQIVNQVNATINSALPLKLTAIVEQEIIERTGPGDNYASKGTVEAGSIAGIFGRDETGRWIYSLTPQLGRGWLPLASLRIIGDASEIPVLPPHPPEPAMPMSFSSSGTDSSIVVPEATDKTPTPKITDLPAITTAKPKNAINMRQGPGAVYETLESLPVDTKLELLAYNKTKDWLLVKTDKGKFGWVWQEVIIVEDSLKLTELPILASVRPSANIPAGQIAPIIGTNSSDDKQNSTVTDVNSSPIVNKSESGNATEVEIKNQTITETAVVMTTEGTPLPPLSFGQVATARIKQSEVLLRLGPGTAYGELTELLHTDEDFYILAVDRSKQWVLVKRGFEDKHPQIGWVALSDMIVREGSTTGASQLVTTWVTGNGVEVRQGPGMSYPPAGNLGNDTLVAVRAVHVSRNWLLIQPIAGGGEVWLPRRFAAASGPQLANVPEVIVPQAPSSEVDPVVEIFGPEQISPKGKLVFQRSSGGDIMVINVDGTGLRRLTNGIDPALSPDGQQVAFTRWSGMGDSVWTINIDGTNERHVLGEVKQPKGPSWSPDGTRLVINYQEGGQLEEQEKCINLSKSGNRYPPREAKDIRVEMKGSTPKPYLCWDMPPNALWNLRMINLADGTFKNLDGGAQAFRPTWDPINTERIISSGGNGLVETILADVNLDNSLQNALTDLPKDRSPAISPDGQYIVVNHGNQSGGPGYNIHRLNRDGSGRVQLTKTPLWVTTGPDATEAWSNVAPAWSPDSRLVAFLTNRTKRWEIWVMNIDGSNQHALFSDAINEQLGIQYDFVDEQVISWR
jgi:Tol biopolymer transport system component/uncharacterized protein YraI